MESLFPVTPLSAHRMILTHEAKGLIEKIPGLGRSIRLCTPREELPDLE
jgi:hypothetical protein